MMSKSRISRPWIAAAAVGALLAPRLLAGETVHKSCVGELRTVADSRVLSGLVAGPLENDLLAIARKAADGPAWTTTGDNSLSQAEGDHQVAATPETPLSRTALQQRIRAYHIGPPAAAPTPNLAGTPACGARPDRAAAG